MSDTENSSAVWDALRASGKPPAPDSPIAYGFWRLVNKIGGYAIPVSTWSEDGFWLARIGDAEIDKDFGTEWSEFLAKTWPRLQAVEYADYQAAIEAGTWLNGMPATKDRMGIGGNNPPEDLEPHEAIAREIAALEQKVGAWLEDIGGKPATKAQADIVAQHHLDFQALEKKAETARVAETDPLHKTWKAAVDKWTPVVKGATTQKQQLFKMGQDFIRVEQARIAEEARKERERLAAIESQKVKEAADAGEPTPEPPPPPPPAAEPPKVTIGTGRQMGARRSDPVIVITDLEAWAGYLGKIDAEGLRPLCEKLALKLAKIGVPHMPGVTVDGKPRISA